MVELFVDLLEVLENIFEIVKCCNIELMLGKNFLFNFLILFGMMIDEFFVVEVKVGLELWLV